MRTHRRLRPIELYRKSFNMWEVRGMKRDKRFIEAIVEGKSEEEKIELLSQEIAKIIFEEGGRSRSSHSSPAEPEEKDSEVVDLFEMLHFSND